MKGLDLDALGNRPFQGKEEVRGKGCLYGLWWLLRNLNLLSEKKAAEYTLKQLEEKEGPLPEEERVPGVFTD